jgi:hypothetical protein
MEIVTLLTPLFELYGRYTVLYTEPETDIHAIIVIVSTTSELVGYSTVCVV